MKTQEQRERSMSLRRTLFAVGLLLGLAVIPEATFAQTNIQTRSIGDLTATYDALEAELLRRVKIQIGDRDPELIQTALALAHIGSKKAVPLFLENIAIVPDYPAEKVGDFYPVRVVRASGYRNVFIMPIVLFELGNNVPLERCVSEIGKAEDKSLRETLLTSLARRLHGEAFMDEVRTRAATQDGKEKWGRLLNQMLKAQEPATQQR
jgi:hypothetical protein